MHADTFITSSTFTLFCSPEPGFSIFTADKKELDMHMIDKKGKVIYTVKRTK